MLLGQNWLCVNVAAEGLQERKNGDDVAATFWVSASRVLPLLTIANVKNPSIYILCLKKKKVKHFLKKSRKNKEKKTNRKKRTKTEKKKKRKNNVKKDKQKEKIKIKRDKQKKKVNKKMIKKIF